MFTLRPDAVIETKMPEEPKRVRRKRKISRTAQRRQRIWRIIVMSAGGLAGLMLGLLILSGGQRVYNHWHEGRLLRSANAFLAEEELDQATQAARDVLRITPDSVPAFRILAEAAERQNRPEALSWRIQIARVQPSLDSQLNLASVALRFGQLDVARTALAAVSPAEREKAAYHVVAGWLARAEGNLGDLENHFAAAVKQEPANELYQFNLAALRITSPVPEKTAEARETLQRLSKSQKFRTGSLRALLTDALHRQDLPAADALAQDLQMTQQVTFADYLLCLDLYRKMDAKRFAALVEKVKPVAARHPADLALFLDWMNANGLSADVLKWIEKLPPEMTTKPPPAVSIAEACVNTKSWGRLKRWSRIGDWHDMEYLRFAYQAQAARQARQAGSEAEFDTLWRSAEVAAGEQAERQLVLARLAARWNLPTEAEQLWQRVAKNPPTRREALDSLYAIYRASNDLPNLQRTARRLHETSPAEAPATANYARLSLLLDQNTAEAHRLAREAFDKAPDDTACLVTYAFSLYASGRTADGLEIMKKLPAESRRDAHVAAFYAVLLLDENQPEAAKPFQDLALSGGAFPEEKKMLQETLDKPATSPATRSEAGPAPGPLPAAIATPVPAPAPSANQRPAPPPPAVGNGHEGDDTPWSERLRSDSTPPRGR